MVAARPMQLFDCMQRSPYNKWKVSWPLWKKHKNAPVFVLFPRACEKRCSLSFVKWSVPRSCFIRIGIVTRFFPPPGGHRLYITLWQPKILISSICTGLRTVSSPCTPLLVCRDLLSGPSTMSGH